MGFHDRLEKAWASSGSMLCVGLDPDPARFPAAARRRAGRHHPLLHGDRRRHRRPGLRVQAADRPLRRAARRAPAGGGLRGTSVSTTPTSCSCSTPSAATSARPPSTTPEEAFGRYGADAVTVNPYLGTDAATPFLERGGVLALCRTSNAGSGELQDLDVGGVAAVRTGGDDGRRALVADRRLRPRRRRHVPRAARRRPAHRRRPADPPARRRRSRAATSPRRSGPARPDRAPA